MGSKEEKEVEHVKPLVNGSKRNDELLIWVTKWTRGSRGNGGKDWPKGCEEEHTGFGDGSGTGIVRTILISVGGIFLVIVYRLCKFHYCKEIINPSIV